MNAFPANHIAVDFLVFVLSAFLGLELVRNVSRLLHTPLMSLTNAISSVSVVAALIVMSEPRKTDSIVLLTAVATALAFVNIVSGFMITERILKMFRKEKKN